MKRKNPCKIIKNAQKTHKNAQIVPTNAQITHKITQKDLIFECEHCNKNFTRSDTRTRHIKKYCKVKKLEDDKKLQEDFNKLKMNNEELKKSQVIQNITNNNTNNNTINNTINIHINNYGKETIDYLQSKKIIKLIKISDGYNGLLAYLKLKHMNPDHKENWNIKVPSLKTSYIEAKVGNKWKTKLIDDIVDKNFTKGQIELQEIIDIQACKEGREDRYGDAIYDSREKKIIDDLDKAIIDKDEFYVKKYKDAQKTHKADLYDHYKNNKEHFKGLENNIKT
jgi:hypothetical protein